MPLPIEFESPYNYKEYRLLFLFHFNKINNAFGI